MQSQNPIIILGGTGRAGREIAALLLEHTSVTVVLAGRSRERAQAAADQLNRTAPDRVSAAQVDVTDPASLRAAFAACRLVIVCVPFTDNAAQHVITATLDAGIDYIDINSDAAKHRVFAQHASHIQQGRSVLLTEAGIIPGCPALLLRQAAREFEHLDEVTVGSLMRDPQMPRGSAADIVTHAGTPAQHYQDGRWRQVGPFAHRWIDFGPSFGKRFTVPVTLPELHALPDTLPVRRLAVYQAGFNPVLNLLLLLWKLLGLSRSARGRRWGRDLFLWANRRFSSPPYGMVVLLEATGQRAGAAHTWRIALQHADVYVATAIPVVAGVLQLLDERIARPQQGFLGHLVEPERFLADCARLGLRVDITGLRR
jgi:saccharopine dehydrogenase (NAD+, L-lysine-forming)